MATPATHSSPHGCCESQRGDRASPRAGDRVPERSAGRNGILSPVRGSPSMRCPPRSPAPRSYSNGSLVPTHPRPEGGKGSRRCTGMLA